jgi:double-stranded uracil-DNA glycosylase
MDWAHLRLTDRIKRDVRVLFVGINPGVRSAQTGHHFAGFSNRFWKLLSDSRLVPEPITYRDDARLTEFGFGITNLIARPSPGIDDLSPGEYVEGWHTLDVKIRRYKPEVVALVGVTLFRAIAPLLGAGKRDRIELGPQPAVIHGARVFVLPNPSGRNANFSYAEMLAAFVALRRSLSVPRGRRARGGGASGARAAGAAGRSHRGGGTDPRTTPSPPAAAPFRTAPRTPAASPSPGRRRRR